MNWNPLYPSDEEVNPLEEAAREAEWEDDLRRAEAEAQAKRLAAEQAELEALAKLLQ